MRGKEIRIHRQRGMKLGLGAGGFARFEQRLTQIDVGNRFAWMVRQGLRKQCPAAGRIATLAHQTEVGQRAEVMLIVLQDAEVRRRRFVRAEVFQSACALEEHIHRIRGLNQTPVDLGKMPFVGVQPGRDSHAPSTLSRTI